MKRFFLAFAVMVYCFFVALNPFSDTHTRFNLEPYPDALFYTTSALSLVQQGKFAVTYREHALFPRVPPLYSLVLAVGYVFHTAPAFFYYTNVALGLFSIVLLFACLQKISPRPLVTAIGLCIYLSHAYIVWLPSLPMTENLIAPVILIILGLFLTEKKTSWRYIGLTAAISALLFIKYTLVLPTLVCALFLVWELFVKKSWRQLVVVLASFCIFGCIFIGYQVAIGFNPFTVFRPGESAAVSVDEGAAFYSPEYFHQSSTFYLQAMAGFSKSFLWLRYPLTTIGLSALFLGGLFFVLKKRRAKEAALLLGIFFAQFPMLVFFYSADSRYIVATIPVFAVGIAYALSKIHHNAFTVMVLIALVVQIFSQLAFAKFLIATNLLGRSTAWQYEAVKVINLAVTENADAYVITALPPLFVQLYAADSYRLLPISNTQEFANKQQYIWGSDIQYQDLHSTYRRLVRDGKTVYLSDAYLSSQFDLQQKFTELSLDFALEKVADGCLNTCNVYRLHNLRE